MLANIYCLHKISLANERLLLLIVLGKLIVAPKINLKERHHPSVVLDRELGRIPEGTSNRDCLIYRVNLKDRREEPIKFCRLVDDNLELNAGHVTVVVPHVALDSQLVHTYICFTRRRYAKLRD